jgi:hypothetical protein
MVWEASGIGHSPRIVIVLPEEGWLKNSQWYLFAAQRS